MRKFELSGRVLSDETDCLVIAEIGHNHQGSLEKAADLFRAAHLAGADAVKLQKRDNRALFTREGYSRPYDNPHSFGATYGEHREALEFGESEYLELGSLAKELGLIFLSTAFDAPSVDFLETVNIDGYKVASGDLRSTPLLRTIAQTGRPMIISTGGATLEDVERAYETIQPINSNFAILQCTAAYPAEAEQLNLRVITTYRERFPEVVIGLSDHQNGIAMSTVAYVLGARIIEKHFTLNRGWKGTDHGYSLEPEGMRKMVRDLRRARQALGDGLKKPLPGEAGPLTKMGKQLVAARPLSQGQVLAQEDVAMKSPGGGIPPYRLEEVLGKVLLRPLSEDEPITFGDLASE